MLPIEEAIVEELRKDGPCCLDHVVLHLSPLLQLGRGIPRGGIYAVQDDKITREQFYYAGER